MAAAAAAPAAAKRAASPQQSTALDASRSFTAAPSAQWGRPPSPAASDADDDEGNSAGTSSGSTTLGAASAGDRWDRGGGKTPASDAGSGRGTSEAAGAGVGTGAFFSEAELGAEITAIAQSIVQRTINGAVSASQRTSDVSSRTPSSGGAQTEGVKSPSAGQPPIGPTTLPAAGTGAAAAAAAATRSSPAPEAEAGSTTALGREAALPGDGVRGVALAVAVCAVPQPGKTEQANEDAYFIVTPATGVTAGGLVLRPPAASPPAGAISALGVADGVGGWAAANVDAGQYSREVMATAAVAAGSKVGPTDPRSLLAAAQAAVRTVGSCTACVACLAPSPSAPPGGPADLLSIANLGDSGVRVVRRGSLVLSSSAQEHAFNMPYQMAHPDNLPDTDTADDAQLYQITVRPGDVIVLATDGLFDNMWDEQLVSLVTAAAAGLPAGVVGPAAAAAAQAAAQQLAAGMANAALRHAQDAAFRSPWAVELANQATASWLERLFPRGGRLDDITVLVAIVTAAD
ncbi:hypothetical protein GPECTOR_44g60 [Gonium pectorale]|uniref:Protein phosphatase n=1 Tax=Gonium pectorale TaxID=33097 RepID=A0A150G9Z6_GONPE|nr:hypothetical protein GPECTOR_44g60 [Gonium pectorale]|eukprot:KXZ46385.1 hypothetical protein GPECTOR_44g60 [Gonium pectorale]